MQIKIDDEVIFEIDDVMMKLLSHDILDPICDVKRRLRWVIEKKCDDIYAQMNDEWMKKFSEDPNITTIPCKKRDFVNAVCSHPEYLNRSQREEKKSNEV